MNVEIGKPAPDFTLPDQDGVEHQLSSYKGTWVIIFFYPKDDTPGCTKEACAFRDHHSKFEDKAKVIGISIDPVAKHKKFVDKYNLPFTLLADEAKEVVNLYGVWGPKKFMGRSYEGTNRVSCLIDPEGNISKVYEKVKPDQHAEEVLADIG